MFVYHRVVYCGDRPAGDGGTTQHTYALSEVIDCVIAGVKWSHDTLYEQRVRLKHADVTASCNSPQTKPAILQFRDVYSSFGHTKYIFLCGLYTGCFFFYSTD